MDTQEREYHRQQLFKVIDDHAEQFYRRINYSPLTGFVFFYLFIAFAANDRAFAYVAAVILLLLAIQNIIFALLFWRDKRMVSRQLDQM